MVENLPILEFSFRPSLLGLVFVWVVCVLAFWPYILYFMCTLCAFLQAILIYSPNLPIKKPNIN